MYSDGHRRGPGVCSAIFTIFVIAGIAKDVPMGTIFRGIWPFFGAMMACVILLAIFPQIATFLPGTMKR